MFFYSDSFYSRVKSVCATKKKLEKPLRISMSHVPREGRRLRFAKGSEIDKRLGGEQEVHRVINVSGLQRAHAQTPALAGCVPDCTE